MINKNGQALVMFIIFLPILIMLMAFTFDTWILFNEKNEISNIIRKAENKKEIENALNINNVQNYKIKEEKGCIIVETSKESVFGKIIGKNEYEIIIRKCK